MVPLTLTYKAVAHRDRLVAALSSVIAVALGIAICLTPGALIGALVVATSALPLLSHARWVGWRRAFAEPSIPTVLVVFYLAVFPQRAIAVWASDFTTIEFAGVFSNEKLISLLALAALGTTAFVELFHRGQRRASDRRRHAGWSHVALDDDARRAVPIAGFACIVALAAVAAIAFQTGGFSGLQAVYLGHSKAASVEARSLATSTWATLGVPSVWFAALVAADGRRPISVRLAFTGLGGLILAAQLVLFGSRLNALLALLGVWVIVHYVRRPISIVAVAGAVGALVLMSVPILAQRPGGLDAADSPIERYSSIVSYSVLDAGLAIRNQPDYVANQLADGQRWLDLPSYLAPSFIWPEKADISERRLDVFTADSVGNQNQRDTGFPTGYLTELWLYGGPALVLFASGVAGFLLGRLDRALIERWTQRGSAASLIWACFTLTVAFSYYKDGDVLLNVVSTVRNAVYLGGMMFLFGLWRPGRRPAIDYARQTSDPVTHGRTPSARQPVLRTQPSP